MFSASLTMAKNLSAAEAPTPEIRTTSLATSSRFLTDLMWVSRGLISKSTDLMPFITTSTRYGLIPVERPRRRASV